MNCFLDLSNKTDYLIVCVSSIVLGTIMFLDSIINLTYNNTTVSIQYGGMIAGYLWTNITLFICTIIPIKLIQDNLLLIIILGGYFFITLHNNIRRNNLMLNLQLNMDELSNDLSLDI